MFVVLINGVDASCHTLEVDALRQQDIFAALSYTNITLEEKDTFAPVYPEV